MTASERIKQTCKNQGISVHKLEQLCGFSNGYISQLKGDLPSDRLYKIAQRFRWPIISLLSDEAALEFLKTHDRNYIPGILDRPEEIITPSMRDECKAEIEAEEKENIKAELYVDESGSMPDYSHYDLGKFFEGLERIEVVQLDGTVKPYYVPKLKDTKAGKSLEESLKTTSKPPIAVIERPYRKVITEPTLEQKLLDLFRKIPDKAKQSFIDTAENMVNFYSGN